MRATTVRFSEDLWELLEAESAKQGISAAQFVRDAAMMRLGTLSSRRGDAASTLTLEALAAGALDRRPAAPDAVLRDPARIDALGRTGLLDSPPDEAFDRLTAMAARLLDAPIALVSLVDQDRQFFKSCTGLGEPWRTRRETPLSHSFCQYALESAEPLIIDDARTHPLVRENLAIRDLDVVAYAGVPLITSAGHTIGALCAIDHQAREWTSEQIETLQVIGAAVTREIERAPATT